MGIVIPSATEVKILKANGKPEGSISTMIYQVEHHPGLWVKIARDGRQGVLTPVPDAIVAHCQDSFVELKRWKEFDALMEQMVQGLRADQKPDAPLTPAPQEKVPPQEKQAFPEVDPRQKTFETVG